MSIFHPTLTAHRLRAFPCRCLPLAALLAGPALAQPTAPDAGQALRELQRAPAVPPRPVPTLRLPAEADTAASDDGVFFTVRGINIEGARAIPEDLLQPLLADLMDQPITLGTLRAGVRRITERYRASGYLLARAYVPAQEMADGRLRVVVLEGTLSGVALDNASFLQDARLRLMANAPLPTGAAVRADALDRALLLIADLPGAGAVQGTLRPGAELGSSELLVHVLPGPRVEGDMRLDNQGNRYTGAHRLSGRVALNGLAGLGDQLELRATLSDRNLWYGRLAYDVAVGHGGLRLGGLLQRSRYTLGREFASLEATGTADTAAVMARYPLLRGLAGSIWISGQMERRRLEDRSIATVEPGRKSAEVLTLELQGQQENLLERGGGLSWTVGGTAGRLRLRDSAQGQPREARHYAKLQYGGRLWLPVAARTQLQLSLTGQQAERSLDSSEKLVLGGAHGVRAYPQGEGLGDSGAIVSVELWQQLMAQMQAGVFVDQGYLHQYAQPGVSEASSQSLRGFGLGLRGQLSALQWNLSLAWRDGRAANSAPDRTPRLWLGLGWQFS